MSLFKRVDYLKEKVYNMYLFKKPDDYLSEDVYKRSKDDYSSCLEQVETIGDDKKELYLLLLDLIIDDLKGSLNIIIPITALLGAIIGLFMRVQEFNTIGLAIYFAIISVIMLLLFVGINKRKNQYVLFRTVLVDTIANKCRIKQNEN